MREGRRDERVAVRQSDFGVDGVLAGAGLLGADFVSAFDSDDDPAGAESDDFDSDPLDSDAPLLSDDAAVRWSFLPSLP